MASEKAKKIILIIAILLVPIAFGGFYYWWVYFRYDPVTTTGGKAFTIKADADDLSLLAAGNISDCQFKLSEQTAKVFKVYTKDIILALGDNAMPAGSAADFDCFNQTWGQYKSRIHPVPGNREYKTAKANGYYHYFGSAAGKVTEGYYSYGLGQWHIVALNTNCNEIGGCGPNSPELQWLKDDLTNNKTDCTLVAMHHPRYTSGQWGSDRALQPIWDVLEANGVDLVLSAHDRVYERLAPMDATGHLDTQSGIRQFVVGTGGSGFDNFGRPLPTSEVRQNMSLGVLRLTLHTGSYDWQFVPGIGSTTFSDLGSGTCHP